MNWQGRIIVLGLIGIPAFTGISPLAVLGEPLPGVSWSAFVYAAVVNLTVGLTCGGAFAASALTVSVLILLPVVLGGGRPLPGVLPGWIRCPLTTPECTVVTTCA